MQMSRFVLAGAVAVVAGTATADRISMRADSLYAQEGAVGTPTKNVGLSEDFEGFPAGPFVSPTGGWSMSYDPVFSIGNAFSGLALQHMSDGSGLSDSAFGPSFGPAFGTLATDVQIQGSGTAVGWAPQGTEGYIVTRVLFDTDGTIDVLQAVGGSGVFVDSGFTWTSGEVFQIGLTLATDGSFRFFKNGVDSGIAFEDINLTLAGVSGGIDGLVFNYYNESSGQLTTFDNISGTIVPAPGVLALAGVGGAAAIRRRRR